MPMSRRVDKRQAGGGMLRPVSPFLPPGNPAVSITQGRPKLRRWLSMATVTTGQAPAQSAHLKRAVGFWGLTFVSLGSIIGSGWLLGALTAAKAAGPASIISWVMAGVFLSLLALVHAELGTSYPVSGGTARFPHFAFGS